MRLGFTKIYRFMMDKNSLNQGIPTPLLWWGGYMANVDNMANVFPWHLGLLNIVIQCTKVIYKQDPKGSSYGLEVNMRNTWKMISLFSNIPEILLLGPWTKITFLTIPEFLRSGQLQNFSFGTTLSFHILDHFKYFILFTIPEFLDSEPFKNCYCLHHSRSFTFYFK